MANLDIKIKLYAAANGVNSIDFEKDVLLEQRSGEDVKIVQWNLSIDEPTTEQLASYETAATTEKTLQGVLNTRANEYKELKEQLDLLYHDMTAGKLDNTGEWHKHIKKVKDDNPKE